MGKKGKKSKGRGAEKAAQKLSKKEMKSEGMENLEAMIAEFQELDRQRTTFQEEKVSHPSPRSNLSVTAHPDKDELIFFGGEYFNGNKMFIYNDVYVYNIKKNQWTKQLIPNPPPPRSSHQAVAVAKEGGQMWVFGGEFASPNNTQFYHYKDLWVLYLKDHRWEQIKTVGGPSQRSGHRMVAYKKYLFVFGGFQECFKSFLYFNDCYFFSLTDYTWTKVTTSGTGPSPRSACQLAVTPNGILVIGGYSKVKLKKDVEKGNSHSDIFLLSGESGSRLKWTQVKDGGQKPWPRLGFALTVMMATRAVLFGGVCDDEDEEDLESFFFNSLSCIDLNSYRWFSMDLRKSKPLKKAQLVTDEEEKTGGDEETQNDEDVASTSKTMVVLPCGRMNALTAIKHNILYVYGGIFEEEEKQITLNDLWCIDIKKMDTWKQLVEADDTSADWFEEEEASSDSENDEKEGAEPTNSIKSIDHVKPPVKENEQFNSYWFRTKEYWLEKASDTADEYERADSISVKADTLARSWFEATA